jgi:hypothetical protein
MAAENFQAKDDFGNTQRVKQLTSSEGVITYTAKVGRPADDFVIDKFIRVTTTSGYAMTITLPNGVYYGQQIHVFFEVDGGGGSTVEVNNAAAGSIATSMDTAKDFSILEWAGSTIGWIEVATEG